MSLTRSFRETVQSRAKRDRRFRHALLREAAELFLQGDLVAGKGILRDYVNATIGFEALSRQVEIPAKSLMRMLGPSGNPRASNLLSILSQLQKLEGVQFRVAEVAV